MEGSVSKVCTQLLQQLASAEKFISAASEDRKIKTNDCMAQSLRCAISASVLTIEDAVALATAINLSIFSADTKTMLVNFATDSATHGEEVVLCL